MKFRAAVFSCLVFLGAWIAPRMSAQTPTPINLSTNASLVMNAVISPTFTPTGPSAAKCPAAAAGTCQIRNLGQGYHIVNYNVTGSPAAVLIRLEATQNGTTWFPISESATDNTGGMLVAFGYFPAIRLNLLTLSSGTLTANYSSSSGFGPLSGLFNPSQQITRNAFVGIAGNLDQPATLITTPYGNAYGNLVISTVGTFGCSATIGVSTVVPGTFSSPLQIATVTVPTGTNATTIVPLPPTVASKLALTFNSCGAPGGATVYASVVFSPPPMDNGFQFLNITTDTQTAVKGTAGFLSSILINKKGTTSTALITDGVISAGHCTGTVIGTVDTTTSATALIFNVSFLTELCVETASAGAANITITYR